MADFWEPEVFPILAKEEAGWYFKRGRNRHSCRLGFVGHGGLQHANAGRKGGHALGYYTYVISEEADLNDPAIIT